MTSCRGNYGTAAVQKGAMKMSSYRGKIAMYGLSVVVMIAIVLAVGSAQTPAKRPTPQASEVDVTVTEGTTHADTVGSAQTPAKRPTPQASEVDVTVTEGTTFAVAASPEGQTLVTDLLGSLWTIPAQGGSAKRITEIVLEAKQPSFSPDGRQIVFEGFYDADGWDLWR